MSKRKRNYLNYNTYTKSKKFTKVSPFQKWRVETDYIDKLSNKEKNYLFTFFDEYFNGNFKGKVYKQNKEVINNILENIYNCPVDFKEFMYYLNKERKLTGKDVKPEDFVIKHIKKKSWREKNHQREDLYMKNINNTFYSIELGREEENKTEITTLNIKQDKMPEFEFDLVESIQDKKLPEFLFNWLYYIIELEYVESKDDIFLEYEEILLNNYEFYNKNTDKNKYKYFGFVSFLNKLLTNNCLIHDNIVLCNKINTVFNNYIFKRRNNLYLKDFFK